jgi:hypothetical protein
MFAMKKGITVSFMFERVKFNDEKGCSRFNLYYAPLLFLNKNKTVRCFL